MKLVILLLQENPNIIYRINGEEETALHLAIKLRYGEIIDALINHIVRLAESNRAALLNAVNDKGQTALHVACFLDNVYVKRLSEVEGYLWLPIQMYLEICLFIMLASAVRRLLRPYR